jgi:hypothetical protein
MKRFLLLVLSVTALIIALVMGTTAVYASYNPNDGEYYSGVGQRWYLFEANPSADYTYDPTAYHTFMMQRAVSSGETGSLSNGNANFTFNNGETLMFFADEKANMDVAFPSGEWILVLNRVGKGGNTDAKWGNYVNARVGYFSGGDPLAATSYTWFGTFNHWRTDAQGTIDTFDVTVPTDLVPQGDTLVIELTNTGLNQLIKQTDGTYLLSPESDPGYPLPEIAAGILLGGGLIGLVGYIVIQKKKTAAAR